MKKFKEMCDRKPFLTSIGVVAVMFIIVFLPLGSLFTDTMGAQEADYLSGIIAQTAAGVIGIYLIGSIGLKKQAGFGNRVKEVWLIWPMVLFILFVGSDFFLGKFVIDSSKPLRVLLLILVYMSTGFFEEIMCRGFVQTVLMKKWGVTKRGKYAALLIASLMFGMLHLIHFLCGTMSLLTSITQITYSAFIGVFMGACLIRCQNIWLPIILHGLIDVFSELDAAAVGAHLQKGYISMPLDTAIALILIALPLFLYGLIIVRKCFKKGELEE